MEKICVLYAKLSHSVLGEVYEKFIEICSKHIRMKELIFEERACKLISLETDGMSQARLNSPYLNSGADAEQSELASVRTQGLTTGRKNR